MKCRQKNAKNNYVGVSAFVRRMIIFFKTLFFLLYLMRDDEFDLSLKIPFSLPSQYL